MENSMYVEDKDKVQILELDDYTKKAVYLGDSSACIIKVYDASHSELSEYVLNQIVSTGLFSVCRADVSGLSEIKVDEAAEKAAFDDRAGMIVYIKENFDEATLSGKYQDGIKLYDVSDDERQEIFVTEVTDLLARINQIKGLVGNDKASIIKMLDDINNKLPEKTVVNFAEKDAIQLTEKQYNQKNQIGYAFAIITLGFLFGGVCVAHSVIEEQNNKVFTRALLTKLTSKGYFISKFIVALIISILQTLVLGVCIVFVPGLDVGISIISFLFITFLLGLIFSALSILLGIIIGDVMSSNYAVFAIWSISGLLSGLYFTLNDTTPALKTLSYFMPQRWFMDAAELLLVGDKSAYPMVLYITATFLIVIISVGGIGLKVKRHE
jgi:ABC-type multidrug transport system permease subunit